ncbi:MAG: tetratricopeptide repeat protein, partial [Gammaproteobacteria bacterium]|nr:tetratricopeptide repeat protein [Gammaproteobacteria bacterium]
VRSRAALNLPIWYEEGFASYLSTLSIDPTGVVTVGRMPYAYLRGVLLLPGLSIPDVIGERFQLDPRRHDLSEVYGLAWAIVRFLHHAEDDNGERYASRLGDMLAAIDNGVSSEDAMKSSLGLDPESLKRRLRSYYDKDQLPVFQFRTQTRDRLAFRYDCLDPIDARKHLAEVAALHHPRFAAELYNSILASNPDHVDALVGLSRIESAGRALELAQKAYRIEPTNPAAIVRMAEIEVLACQSDSANCGDALANAIGLYTEALTSDRHRVAAAYGLGILSLHVDRPHDALEYLRAAYTRAPWSPQIHYYLGEAYGRAGEKKRAVPHLRKTAFWHPHESWRQRARQMLARLGEDSAATDRPRINPLRSAP